jgi:hypothetical protein
LVPIFSNPARIVLRKQWRHVIKVPPPLLQTTKINIYKPEQERQRRKVLFEINNTYIWRWIGSRELIDMVWDDAHTLQNLLEALQNFLLGQLLHGDHSGWILGPSILEAVGLPRLQGLNLATKVASDDPKPSYALLFQDLDSIKKQLDFLEILGCQGRLLPPIIGNRPSIRVHSEGRLHVASIEPLGSLVFQRIDQSIVK